MHTAIVIFGASGDLTQKKLFPGLHGLYKEGELQDTDIIGHARSPITTQQFRKKAAKIGGKSFSKKFKYVQAEYDDLQKLSQTLSAYENILFYCSTPPQLVISIMKALKKHNLLQQKKGWRRVAIEKPFGHDYASATKLNTQLTGIMDEKQIFRIDHYLGKSLIQDLLVLRFTNSIFENLCTGQHVDHIQITVAEKQGVSNRLGYYDHAGALKDMIQSHLLQILCLISMEPPASLYADDIRNEKSKVLASLQVDDVKHHVIAGQYKGYEGKRKTETYVAVKARIKNLRWGNVPFYLRTGKKLKQSYASVHIVFKELPCVLYCKAPQPTINANRLTINIQPEEGISIQFNTKTPGFRTGIVTEHLHYSQGQKYGKSSHKAYEYILRDLLIGDATRFTRSDEVAYAWKFIDSITAVWKHSKKVHAYLPGTTGPEQASKLMEKDGRAWIEEAT